jgi:hypothetical protein
MGVEMTEPSAIPTATPTPEPTTKQEQWQTDPSKFQQMWATAQGNKTWVSLLALQAAQEIQKVHPTWPYWGVVITILQACAGIGLLDKIRRAPVTKRIVASTLQKLVM